MKNTKLVKATKESKGIKDVKELYKNELCLEQVKESLDKETEQDGNLRDANVLKFEILINTAAYLKKGDLFFPEFRKALQDKNESIDKHSYSMLVYGIGKSWYNLYIQLHDSDARVIKAYKEQVRLGNINQGLNTFASFNKNAKTKLPENDKVKLSENDIEDSINPPKKESTTVLSYTDKTNKDAIISIRKDAKGIHTKNSIDELKNSFAKFILELENKVTNVGKLAPAKMSKVVKAKKETVNLKTAQTDIQEFLLID
jgi:hypothetical protein